MFEKPCHTYLPKIIRVWYKFANIAGFHTMAFYKLDILHFGLLEKSDVLTGMFFEYEAILCQFNKLLARRVRIFKENIGNA